MRLPFSRSTSPPPTAPPPPADDADPAVQAARTRARQRLAGALVLLANFPAGDLPIEVDRSVTSPAAGSGFGSADAPRSTPAPQRPTAPTDDRIAAGPIEPTPPLPPPPTIAPTPPPPAAATPSPTAPPAATDETAPSRSAAADDDGQRARALLDGAAPSSGARYVVQAGAYAEDTAVRDARRKVERLGLKTYVQVVATPAGPRTRVRVGPYTDRAAADAAAAKVKAAGLQASVLTL